MFEAFLHQPASRRHPWTTIKVNIHFLKSGLLNFCLMKYICVLCRAGHFPYLFNFVNNKK